MSTVLIVAVNYHSDEEIARFLGALSRSRAQAGGDCAVVIVDNGANDPETLEAMVRAAGAELVRAGQNLGYFGGAHFGLECYLRLHPMPDWVVVSNPDVEISPSFFRLTDIAPDEMAVIAPCVLSLRTGRDQNPYMRSRISRTRLTRIRLAHRSTLSANVYRLLSKARGRLRPAIRDGSHGESAEIYAAHGACLALSRQYFERGGILRYGAFLFCEELHVAETARKLGLAIVYRPDLLVYHREHATTRYFRSKQMVKMQADALDYCLRHYW